jgi:hypothetical protein
MEQNSLISEGLQPYTVKIITGPTSVAGFTSVSESTSVAGPTSVAGSTLPEIFLQSEAYQRLKTEGNLAKGYGRFLKRRRKLNFPSTCTHVRSLCQTVGLSAPISRRSGAATIYICGAGAPSGQRTHLKSIGKSAVTLQNNINHSLCGFRCSSIDSRASLVSFRCVHLYVTSACDGGHLLCN